MTPTTTEDARNAAYIRYRSACLDADLMYHRTLAALWGRYREQLTAANDALQADLVALYSAPREEKA